MVSNSTQDAKVEGSIPASAAVTGTEKMIKSFKIKNLNIALNCSLIEHIA